MERGYAERLLVTYPSPSCSHSLQAVAEGGSEAGEGVVWRYLLQQSNGLCEGSEGGSYPGKDGRDGVGEGERGWGG